ncbi:MAG TPA: glycosyltransferase family 39 protein [Candidatus Hydrogenedentes bacterium]|nr:glycosyltransferase family 39 protein [Candidatus Hydrogenedentota bacterium]
MTEENTFPAPAPPPQAAPRPDPGHGPWMLAVVLAAQLVLGVVWLAMDHHDLRGDEAHHLRTAADYYALLGAPPEEGRLAALAAFRSPYPPLPQLLGAAAAPVFGFSPDRLTYVPLGLFGSMILGVYLLARRTRRSGEAARAALLFSCMPLAFGMSRLFSPDMALAALCLWALYALLRSEFLLRPGWARAFGVLAGMAWLCKPEAPAHLLVPALVWAAWGILRAASGAVPAGAAPFGLRRHLARLVLVALLAAGPFAGWSLYHRADLVAWWGAQRGTAEGLVHGAAAGWLGPFGETPPPTRPPLDDPDLRQDPPPPPRRGAETAPAAAAERYWPVYAAHAVNEALFLPLALLAVLGVPALLLRRNRTAPVLLCLLWAAGGVLALAGLFTLRSPRFLLPLLPALALLADTGFDVIPGRRVRAAATVLLCGAAVFQCVNLSFLGLGPVFAPHDGLPAESRALGNTGLALFKPKVAAGNYTLGPPQREASAVMETFRDIALHERRLAAAPDAGPATVALVAESPARLGAALHARFFDPDPAPLRPTFLGAADASPQPLRPAATVAAPEELLTPPAAPPDHVLLWSPTGGDHTARLEAWAAELHAAGYVSLSHRRVPAWGALPEGWLHALGRRPPRTPETATTLFDVYDLLRDPAAALTDQARMELEGRFADLLRPYQGTARLGDGLRLLGMHVTPLLPGWAAVRIVLLPETAQEGDLALTVTATPRPEDLGKLPPVPRELGMYYWDFFPDPPSTAWRAGETVILSRQVMVETLAYRIALTLRDAETGAPLAETVEAGTLDFAALEEK